MAQGRIILRAGEFRDPQMILGTVAHAAEPKHDVVVTGAGDTLASVTQRAYGHNSRAAQERILAANANLDGFVKAPR